MSGKGDSMDTFMFTSESVGEGHPGKTCFAFTGEIKVFHYRLICRQNLRSSKRCCTRCSLGTGPKCKSSMW